jgi:type 2A phosphatase activator TIP41
MQLHLERYGGKKTEEEENKREEGKEKNEETQSERTTVLDIDELAKEGSSYDWTFTTPYRGTTTVRGEDIGGGEGGGEGVNSSELNSNTNIRWKPTEERLDMALLTRRDPIELFDEISLYESELDDHGVSSLSVKIRVTESCWFLLLRFWLCVDGVLIRSRETRLCCDLRRRRDATAKAGAVVLRETRLREETWSQLKDRGASTDAKQYKDAEEAASVLLAGGGPVRVVNEKLEIVV